MIEKDLVKSELLCWFCGNNLQEDNSISYYCWYCHEKIHVVYRIWHYENGEIELSDVYFRHDPYCIQLKLDAWGIKTRLLKMDRYPEKAKRLISFDYLIDINPQNAAHWIERLKLMVPFS